MDRRGASLTFPTPSAYRGGSGPPLLLIHGAGGTWRQWRPVIPLLELHHEVLVPNLVGHWGGPPQPAGTDANIDLFVDSIERDLDQAGWATAHVAGISLGGLNALVLARRGRARTCTAIATIGGWDAGGDPHLRGVASSYRLFHRITQSMAQDPARWSRRPRLRRMLFWHHFAHTHQMDPAETAHMIVGAANAPILPALFDYVALHDGPTGLEQITCPVQLLFPAKDLIFPKRRCAPRLQRAIPHAEIHDLTGAGHCATWDAPERLAERIIAFTTPRPGTGAPVR